MGAEATRERIMDAADRLFGSQGFSGTSLRALTREAGVNLAAVNYHFGTKHELLRATLSRHFDAINAGRLERLDALEQQHADGAIPLKSLVATLIRPAFEFSHASPENAEVVRRLSALVHSEPLDLLQPVLEEIFGEVSRRFELALTRVLPQVPREDISLRLGFAIGCMISQLAGRNPPMLDNPALTDSERIDHLVYFVAAGLSSPAPDAERA